MFCKAQLPSTKKTSGALLQEIRLCVVFQAKQVNLKYSNFSTYL